MNTQIAFFGIGKHGPFLGTRLLGEIVRKEILEACRANQQVVIDFAGVDTLSPSFADECFGVLLDELGIETFKEKLRFKGTTSEINSLLRLVTSRRAKAQIKHPA